MLAKSFLDYIFFNTVFARSKRGRSKTQFGAREISVDDSTFIFSIGPDSNSSPLFVAVEMSPNVPRVGRAGSGSGLGAGVL